MSRGIHRGGEETTEQRLLRLERTRRRLYREIADDELLALSPEHHADAERRISHAIEQLEEIARRIALEGTVPPVHD